MKNFLFIFIAILIISLIVYALISINNKNKENSSLEATPIVRVTNILPSGSTSAQLQAAINSASSGDIIGLYLKIIPLLDIL